MSVGTDLVVVDPRDGTVLEDLAEQPAGLLAHVALELKRRETEQRRMREHVEAELTDRVHAAGRRIVVIDEFELRIDNNRGRTWDGDELEAALRQLVDEGVLHAGELTGLISHETRVDGKKAQRLLGMLTGHAHALVETCFRWESKGRPRLSITPNVQLPAPEEVRR